MPEVLRLATRVTVLRDGRHVSTRPLAETGQGRIIEEMTGRDLSGLFPSRPDSGSPGPVVLEVADLSAGALRSASFALRAGEVLGA